MKGSILVQCKMRTRFVIVGAIFCQQMVQVTLAEHHDMVEALASDRSDQPFNMTILPW
jgi:hypothetical protein